MTDGDCRRAASHESRLLPVAYCLTQLATCNLQLGMGRVTSTKDSWWRATSPERRATIDYRLFIACLPHQMMARPKATHQAFMKAFRIKSMTELA